MIIYNLVNVYNLSKDHSASILTLTFFTVYSDVVQDAFEFERIINIITYLRKVCEILLSNGRQL